MFTENSLCKGPEVGTGVVFSRSIKKSSNAAAGGGKERWPEVRLTGTRWPDRIELWALLLSALGGRWKVLSEGVVWGSGSNRRIWWHGLGWEWQRWREVMVPEGPVELTGLSSGSGVSCEVSLGKNKIRYFFYYGKIYR